MLDDKKIYWELESHDAFSHKLSGTLDSISLSFHLQGKYPDEPIRVDRIIRELRALEATLIEAAAINKRRKETP